MVYAPDMADSFLVVETSPQAKSSIARPADGESSAVLTELPTIRWETRGAPPIKRGNWTVSHCHG